MSRYKDFDAAVAELEPIEFTARGHRYSIAGDPDGSVVLRLMAEGRLQEPSAAAEILESLLGAEQFARLQGRDGGEGIGLSQFSLLTEWIMEQLGFSNAIASVEGAGEAGNGSRSPTR